LFSAIENSTIKNIGIDNVNIPNGVGYVGVFVGDIYGNCNFNNCYATGSLYATSYQGCFWAYNNCSSVTVSNCYSKIVIKSTTNSVYSLGPPSGGGSNKVINCYFVNYSINSNTLVYNIMGGSNTTITNSYYNQTIDNGPKLDASLVGLTTAQMKMQESYINWDFGGSWAIDTTGVINDGYPYLTIFNKTQLFPTISIVSYTKNVISDEVGATSSNVTFKSDQILQAWEARANGNGHGAGLLVGSGGALTANTNVSFDVDYTELTGGDGNYTINVYGQNESGAWSSYGS
jgi:hypothetical protein